MPFIGKSTKFGSFVADNAIIDNAIITDGTIIGPTVNATTIDIAESTDSDFTHNIPFVTTTGGGSSALAVQVDDTALTFNPSLNELRVNNIRGNDTDLYFKNSLSEFVFRTWEEGAIVYGTGIADSATTKALIVYPHSNGNQMYVGIGAAPADNVGLITANNGGSGRGTRLALQVERVNNTILAPAILNNTAKYSLYGLTDTGNFFSVNAQESSPRDFEMSPDGTKIIVTGISGANIVEYTLSTPFDLSSASFTYALPKNTLTAGGVDIFEGDNDCFGARFSPDGFKIFLLCGLEESQNPGANYFLVEFPLATAYDISTITGAVAATEALAIGPARAGFTTIEDFDDPSGFDFSADGTKLVIVERDADALYSYDLATGFDLSSIVSTTRTYRYLLLEDASFPQSTKFSPDGRKIYVTCTNSDKAYEYYLHTAYDISTISKEHIRVFDFSTLGYNYVTGIAFNDTGDRIFVIDSTTDTVREFSVSGTSVEVAGDIIVDGVIQGNGSGLTNVTATKVFVEESTDDDQNYNIPYINNTGDRPGSLTVDTNAIFFNPGTNNLLTNNATFNGSISSTSTTTGTLTVGGGVGIGENINLAGRISFRGDLLTTDDHIQLFGAGFEVNGYGIGVEPGGALYCRTGGNFRWYIDTFADGGVSDYMELGRTGLTINGTLTATSKSFDIEHPTKKGQRLRYGSLEGPENGVYVRGRQKNDKVIELPDYWTGLVHEDSITVNLTPIGGANDMWVEDIRDNKVYIGSYYPDFEYFFTVFAERKDIDKLTVEYES